MDNTKDVHIFLRHILESIGYIEHDTDEKSKEKIIQ